MLTPNQPNQGDDNKKPGGRVGLCTDREGKLPKVDGCSYVVVKDYSKDSQTKDVVKGVHQMQETNK